MAIDLMQYKNLQYNNIKNIHQIQNKSCFIQLNAPIHLLGKTIVIALCWNNRGHLTFFFKDYLLF